MENYQFVQWRNLAWKSSIAAAVGISLTSIYFAVILPIFGFTFEMLDDHQAAIKWYSESNGAGIFQGLMALYFISQLVLLPLPFALHNLFSRESNVVYSFLFALIGTAGAIIALAGPIFLFGNIPELTTSYSKGSIPMDIMVMTGNMFADLTKDFRLFSEVLIGIWLIGFGFLEIKKPKTKFTLVGIMGIIILVVPAWKLVDPFMAPEDYIGLILCASFILLSMISYKLKYEE